MSRGRGTVIAGALVALLALAGCGLGPGAAIDPVELTVTRDFGTTTVLGPDEVDVTESDTVMRVLEGEADVETRYGGGFVQSIDGIAGGQRDGSPFDWFFFVDGVESPIGAADFSLRGGERIWWDYRDWGAANRVPAVVGSYPAPFASGYEGRRYPVRIACRTTAALCGEVSQRLTDTGASVSALSGEPGGTGGAIVVLVGPWSQLRQWPAAARIEAGPAISGVFADFEQRGGRFSLVGLDEAGDPAAELGPSAGLVAATRRYEEPPVWVVTGGDEAAVEQAVDLLDAEALAGHFAVAEGDEGPTPLPLR